MKKSDRTKRNILEQGMDLVSSKGLMGVSIGDMAKACGLSRSGLIAHFKNKEEMQIEILKYSEDEFITHVLKKSYTKDPMEHLLALTKNWLNWTKSSDIHLKGGCPFVRAAIEFKDAPESPVRQYMEYQQKRLLVYLSDMAKKLTDAGLFNTSSNDDQFAYEIYSAYLGHTILKGLLNEQSADDKFKVTLNDLINKRLIN